MMITLKRLSRNSLCWLMSFLITLQPNLVEAQDATITVDPATPSVKVETTINNTPLLQIVAPNASGVSHNKFTDFNVGTSGLVINNAKTNTNTQIGGAILANPNFNGSTARLILNEVTSANRSSLKGFTEIAGDKADYILANPNGITCNGCGFINTSRSTLTTGTPTFDGTSLDSLSVTAGDIVVNSLGLNANDADAFDIITRAATISGAINAQELNIIAGRNDVKYADRTVTKKADDGSTKPTLAIDSSALGGMYAGRIALIANETGVGVNMQGDIAASTSDLTITADGRIDFKKATAANNLTVTSQNTVDVATRAYAGNNLEITAPTIDATDATVGASQNVTLSGTNITGTNAQIVSGLQSDGTSKAQGDVNITATGGSFAYDGGTVRAGQNVTISATTVNGGASSNGITSLGNTTIKDTTTQALSGNLSVGGNLSLTGG
ncbi:MAG: filamentous hemagglutinin N-terminal domain-containing protein, partial [Methylocystaceae bacterium]|nr:filamentous hemagglutinin N-terminal domain-containing protein [Methylocystaceae bacterium]